METPTNQNRRNFIKATAVLTVAGIGGLTLLQSCGKGEDDLPPTEDLMREHGLLNRILLIYDYSIQQLNDGKELRLQSLRDSASIIRNFVENYHEKQEEDYIFPRFEKAGKLTDLVKTLRQQHDAGRNITNRIIGMQSIALPDERMLLKQLLTSFNYMYRPHEAREDTILFPELRKIVSAHEFGAMGEDFEKREHQIFGKDGFEMMLDKVATIEKQLGLYELAQFTPAN